VGFFSIVRLNTRKIESSEAKRIKFVARIHIDNPFRCTVTDYSYFALWKAFRAHRTVHQRRLLSVSPNLTTSYEKRGLFLKSRSKSLSTVSSLRFRIKNKKDNSKVGSWNIRLALTPAIITSELTSELMGQPTPQKVECSTHNLIGQPTPQTVKCSTHNLMEQFQSGKLNHTPSFDTGDNNIWINGTAHPTKSGVFDPQFNRTAHPTKSEVFDPQFNGANPKWEVEPYA